MYISPIPIYIYNTFSVLSITILDQPRKCKSLGRERKKLQREREKQSLERDHQIRTVDHLQYNYHQVVILQDRSNIMGNSLRCCLACVLPCGALDLIRIVHLNGYVEEITRPVTAGEILEANPNHVLSKPCSQGVVRRILILSPESELKRGSIYFLIPASSVPEKKKKSGTSLKKSSRSIKTKKSCTTTTTNSSDCDRYLSEIISEKKSSSRRDRHRSGRVGVWRPHLESISED